MPVWTTADITRFANNGEDDFVTSNPCIVDRVALSIISGTSEYTLSDVVTNIRRVTWKGIKLSPLPHRIFREGFQGAGTQQGRPYWYIFNNIGQSKIKLYPCPNETIASTTTGLFSTAISTKCIVEYYRTSDYTTFIIPEYLRRRLIKAYVLRQCFSVENQGQNIKSSKYFDNKWSLLTKLYSELLQELNGKPRKLVLGTGACSAFPGSPLLPIDRFGVYVNTGE